MRSRVKKVVLGTPLEPVARRCVGLLRKAGFLKESLADEDRWLIEVMARVLRPDSNCIDVGSSRGMILAHMVRFAPRGAHYAFEPLPHRAEGLRRSFPGVHVFEMALSDESGESEFHHIVDDTGYSGLKRRRYPSEDMRVERIVVRVDTLDNVIPAEAKIDLVKIDVEGAELQVLRGAERTLRRHGPLVAFEHGPGGSDYYGTTPDMVYDFFAGRCGYRISLFPTWLEGGPALGRDEFVSQYGGEHFNFLAHP